MHMRQIADADIPRRLLKSRVDNERTLLNCLIEVESE
jgi:hypothetical protein